MNMISLRKKILAFDEGMALYCSLEKDEDDIAMVGGFPVVIIVSLLTKKLPQNTVDSIFECYK